MSTYPVYPPGCTYGKFVTTPAVRILVQHAVVETNADYAYNEISPTCTMHEVVYTTLNLWFSKYGPEGASYSANRNELSAEALLRNLITYYCGADNLDQALVRSIPKPEMIRMPYHWYGDLVARAGKLLEIPHTLVIHNVLLADNAYLTRSSGKETPAMSTTDTASATATPLNGVMLL